MLYGVYFIVQYLSEKELHDSSEGMDIKGSLPVQQMDTQWYMHSILHNTINMWCSMLNHSYVDHVTWVSEAKLVNHITPH